jgi:GT2 family glycosyltransferase
MLPFTVVVPTWKNLDFLDLMYRGLRRNSSVEHQLIVFFNEMDDSARRWAGDKQLVFLGADGNLGVCGAVNRAAELAEEDYVCYMNDDMYPLPGWDQALWQYTGIAERIWLSGTAIEPGPSTPCYIGNTDYGTSPDSFREEELLRDHRKLMRPYNMVSTWTPVLLTRRDWESVGGFDEKYFPGFGSDPDLAMKMYRHGCRHFIGVGTSLVYHFPKSTTGRFQGSDTMDPRRYFRKKWGTSWSRFLAKTLKRDSVVTPDLLRGT